MSLETQGYMSEMATKIAKHTEEKILEQLNEFISRGLIVLEMGPMSFVSREDGPLFTSPPKMLVEIRRTVRLVLKDQEYIERIEKENRELRDVIQTLQRHYPTEAFMSNEKPRAHRKSYLGDGVYVEVENGMLKLTAENGISASDTIYLEPEVMDALVAYYTRAQEPGEGKTNVEENRSY